MVTRGYFIAVPPCQKPRFKTSFLSVVSVLLNHLLVQRKMKSGICFQVALGWREKEEYEEHLGLAPCAAFHGNATFSGPKPKTGLETPFASHYLFVLFNLMSYFHWQLQDSTNLDNLL